MSKTVDLELKKAFTELQQMMMDTQQKIKFADLQIESLKRAKQKAELTSVEISSLPKETNTYETVGRMFILTPTPTVLENLRLKSVSCSEKIRILEHNKAFLENSIRESENHIREMVQQRKEQK